eukprot:TRINITY_DN36973_c0_g1_i6.p1 TRINITY_DN36973_c0_g1~~TRINITY_DN36973_c0_g1_i6.p1  ORF type:complete len:187 (+),score=50.93 TRINITY_DN36973_c0_g1_i6:90-650(+)
MVIMLYIILIFFFFFFKQKTAYEMLRSLVGSEMCIRDRYSHWNCDDCRKAYARWAVAMTLPACALNAGDTEGGSTCAAIKPCVRICNEVVQKCPVTLGFTCPSDNRDYSDGTYCETLSAAETSYTPAAGFPTSQPTYYASRDSAKDYTFTTECCNPMGLQSSAVAKVSSTVLMLVCMLLLVAAFHT